MGCTRPGRGRSGERAHAATLLAGLVVLLLGANPVFAQTGSKAGVAAAVNGQVQQLGRTVGSGDAILVGIPIVTGPAGGLQIMLLDGTTLALGPNTSIVIDDFAWEPSSGSGRLTVAIANGSVRLISDGLGRLDHEAIRVRLPVATVGVHDSIATFSNASAANSWLIALEGGPSELSGPTLVVHNQQGAQLISHPGQGCTITRSRPVCNPSPTDATGADSLVMRAEFLRMSIAELAFRIDQLRHAGLDEINLMKIELATEEMRILIQLLQVVFQDASYPRPSSVKPFGAP